MFKKPEYKSFTVKYMVEYVNNLGKEVERKISYSAAVIENVKKEFEDDIRSKKIYNDAFKQGHRILSYKVFEH